MAQDENRDKIRPKLRGKRFFVTASSRTAGTDTMETKDYTIISKSFSSNEYIEDKGLLHTVGPVLFQLQEMQNDINDIHAEVSQSVYESFVPEFASLGSASFGVISSSLIPDKDDKYDLGASGKEWNDLHLDGTANLDRADIGVVGTNLIPLVPANKLGGQTIGSAKARWSRIFLASTIDVSGSQLVISSPSASAAGDNFNVVVSGSIDLSGSLIPGDLEGGSIGTIDAPFKDLYVQSASIYFANMSDHNGKSWKQMTKNEKLARTTTFHKDDIDKLKEGKSLNDNGHISASGNMHIVGKTHLKGETTIEGETSIKGDTRIDGFTDIRGDFKINGSTISNLKPSLEFSDSLRPKTLVSSSAQIAANITGSFTSLSASIATDINNAGGGTIDSSLTNGSTNAVQNNAVFDGLATKLNLSGGTMTGLIQPVVATVKSALNKNTLDARATNVFQFNSKQAIAVDLATATHVGQEMTIVNLGQGAVRITHQGKPIQMSFFIYGGSNLTIATGQVYKFVYTAVNQWLLIQ